ncbi:MAG: hypothetical protein PHW53_04695 [Patescibacteria group bacterium]|nr:hypothetical protein [Patescibacteria group bacterium]
MKIKAKPRFKDYRLSVLHPLTRTDYRALQAGRIVDVDDDTIAVLLIYGIVDIVPDSKDESNKKEVK